MKKFVGKCITPAIMEIAVNWAHYRKMDGTNGLTGVDALFVPVDETCGIKFFRDKNVAVMSFWLCRILAHINYTPKVCDFRLISLKGKHVWCFMMERCTVLTTIAETHGNARRERIYNKAYNLLRRRLEATTLFFDHDYHFANMGINQAGHVVCIDVGHMSYKYNGEGMNAKMMKHQFDEE